jgi:hypothetical protein
MFAATLGLASCAQQEDPTAPAADDIQPLRLTVSDNGFKDITPTRASDAGYTTTFVEGDAIGVFAVRNGAVIEDISNRKFTYTEGVWELDGDVIEYKGTDFNKMQFFAYYPYQATMAIDPSKVNTADPSLSDPFETVVSNWTIGADQSGDNYTQYDLMTSVGAAQGERLQGKVSFQMKHRMSLAVIEMPKINYSFTNGGMADYQSDVSVGEFTMNGTAMQPYYDATTETYQALVKPATAYTIAGTYTGASEMEYSAQGTLESGTAKKYVISDPTSITYTLAVGDYYCASGKLVSGNEETVPEDCIGIVFYVGNPQPSALPDDASYTETNDALRRDYPNATHGLVVAMDNATRYGVTDVRFASTSTSQFAAWFTSDPDWSDKFITDIGRTVNPGFLGYNNTVLMEMSPSTTACDSAMSFITTYREEVPAPKGASRWFIPTLREYETLTTNLAAVNAKLNAANTQTGGALGTALITGGALGGTAYWTSKERDRNTTIVYQHNLTAGSLLTPYRDRGSQDGLFRFMLAF